MDFKDVQEAFEFASAAPDGEARAYLHKITGKVYWQSKLLPELEPLPDDIDSDHYIVLPDKRDLELGRRVRPIFEANEHFSFTLVLFLPAFLRVLSVFVVKSFAKVAA